MRENRHIRRGKKARTIPRIAHKSSLRFVVLMLGLIALAVQIFVIQTHIHIPQTAGKAQTVSLVTLAAVAVADKVGISFDTAPAAPRDKYPITEDPTNCPLCQEVAHSGQFMHSAAILTALPFAVTVHFIDFDEALPSF